MKNINTTEVTTQLKKLTKAELTELVGKLGQDKIDADDKIKTITNENIELQRSKEGKPTTEQEQEIIRLKQKAIDLQDELSSTKNSMALAKRTQMPAMEPNQINGFLAYDNKLSRDGKEILSSRNQQKAHMNISYQKEVLIDGKKHLVTVEDTKKIWLQVGTTPQGSYWFSGMVFHDDMVNKSFIKVHASNDSADHTVDDEGKQEAMTPSN